MPGFNIAGGEAGGLPESRVEVARLHRWRFSIPQVGALRDVVLYALSCQRPGVEFDPIVVHHKQTQIHLPGKHRWKPINAKFYEISGFHTSSYRGASTTSNDTTTLKIFQYWAFGANKVVDFGTNVINTNFFTNVEIFLTDGAGTDIHKYKLFRAWPSKIDPTELVYTSSELATIGVTFTYDSAFEESS